MADKVNILENWKRHFYDVSSDFNINKKVNRNLVDFIYTKLNDFWGNDFFETNLLDAVHANKVYFLQPMLGQPSLSSFYYLLEVAMMIDFASDKHPDLYKSLNEVKFLPEKSKDILFEIYIALFFYMNKVTYQTNILTGNQPRDGYCTLNGKKYLVECKKRYSIIQKEISLRKYLISEIMKIAKSITYGLECIGVLTIKTSVSNRQMFLPILKAFKNYIVNRTEYSPVFLVEDDFIRMELKPYNDSNRIELENNLIPHTIYFTITNLNKIKEDIPQFRVQVTFKAVANHRKVAKKLIESIKSARKQHKDSKTLPRIFFIDNEFLNDFSSPLLHNIKVYEDYLQKYVSEKNTNDLVVLLYRDFTGKTPSIKASIICKQELLEVKSTLEKMQYYTIGIEN